MTSYLGVESQYVLAACVAFSGVFALGVMFSILGSVKLKLAEALGIDDAKIGTLISALMFSCMIAVLIIGPLTDLLGYRLIALVGFVLGAICVWLLASARSYAAALVACLLLGIAAMSVNTVGNTLGPTILFSGNNAARASNVLNVFFGLGAFITPLIAAYLLGSLGYKKTVGLIGILLFLPAIYSAFSAFPPTSPGFNIAKSLTLLSDTAVLVSGLALFCYIALEATMGGFVTTYLKSHNFSDKTAGTLLSGFWISLMAARLITAIFLGDQIDPAMLVPALGVLAVVGIGIMVSAPSPSIGALGTMITGFALGPIFPTLVGVAFGKTDAVAAGTAGSVFGLIFAIGLIGGTIVPALIGKFAAQMNIRQSLKIALVVAVALVVVSSALWLAVPGVQAGPEQPSVTEIKPKAPMFRPVRAEDVVIEPPAVQVQEAQPAPAPAAPAAPVAPAAPAPAPAPAPAAQQ